MTIPLILLIGLSLAMDSFAVSVTRGALQRNKFKFKDILEMAFLFGIFHIVMPITGWVGGIGLRAIITGVDHWIAFGLLGFVGGRMIYEANKPENEKLNVFGWRTKVLLALATSIDALAVGISFAFLNVLIVPSAIMIGTVIFIMTIIGSYIGKQCGGWFGKKSEFLGGIILIVLGLKILIEHLFY